jgi:hypothetical protein
MTVNITLPMIIYAAVFILLILLARHRYRRMLEALADLEDYFLDNNIWISHFVPNLIILIIIIIMAVYPIL